MSDAAKIKRSILRDSERAAKLALRRREVKAIEDHARAMEAIAREIGSLRAYLQVLWGKKL